LSRGYNAFREGNRRIKQMPKKKINVEEPLDKAVYDALLSESDRGAVLLGAALIEESLKKLLRQFLIEDSETAEKLFWKGPLQSAGASNQIAYCLGLISKQELEDIERIQQIRNQFAHQLLKVRFENNEIEKSCVELTAPDEFMRTAKGLAPRLRFTLAVVILSGLLERRRKMAKTQQRKRADPILKYSISIE
jgi:DNA-binding MltR family transcriptional regulator